MFKEKISCNYPIVSVVIPTYNRAHTLARSIKSVLNQTYQNFEVIVVDDFSVDNTSQFLMSCKDKRVHYIRLDKNYGGSYARNVGIQMSKGRYIAFQDSDDEWMPEKLQEQVALIENAGDKVGLVFTGFNRIKDDFITYVPSGSVNGKNGDVFLEIIKKNFVGTPTVLIKKECFERVGLFDVNLSRLQDWDLFIRVSMYYHFLLINKPLVTAYSQENSISNNNKALIVSTKIIISKYFFIFKFYKVVLSDHYLNLARLLYEDNDKSCRHFVLKSLIFNVLNIRALLVCIIGFKKLKFYSEIIKKLKRCLCFIQNKCCSVFT